MNRFEFEQPKHLNNDMKKKSDINVEFSKEFLDEIKTEKQLTHRNFDIDENFLLSKRKKYSKKNE